MQTTTINRATKSTPRLSTRQQATRSLNRRINKILSSLFSEDFARLTTKGKLKVLHLALAFGSFAAFSEESILLDGAIVMNFALAAFEGRNVLQKK